MHTARTRQLRRAFTLIELLVVMGIIVLIATMGYFAYPTFSGPNNVASGVDRTTGWLLIAKQRAKRDGLPTGIRITQDPNTGYYSVLQYIQQPDVFAAGRCIATSGSTVTFSGVTFTPVTALSAGTTVEAYPVAPGDYLELYGGPLHRIISVPTSTTLTLDPNTTPLPTNLLPTGTSGPNYRIIRQPRLLSGEDALTLATNVGIDTNTVLGFPLSNPPFAAGGSGNGYEILFAPSGAVIGQGTPSGQIYLWVRDMSQDNSANLKVGFPIIVSIQVRTGFISSQPVGPNTDPFLFTRNARASGI